MTPEEFDSTLREYGYQMFAKAGDAAHGIQSICDRDMAAIEAKDKLLDAYKELYEQQKAKERRN